MSISIYNRKDHGWRDSFNPLRGLSMPKLVSILEAGERGDFADIQWLYFYMERSDTVIYSVIQRRRAALLAVDWDIRMVSDGDKGLAREQAAFLGEVMTGLIIFGMRCRSCTQGCSGDMRTWRSILRIRG